MPLLVVDPVVFLLDELVIIRPVLASYVAFLFTVVLLPVLVTLLFVEGLVPTLDSLLETRPELSRVLLRVPSYLPLVPRPVASLVDVRPLSLVEIRPLSLVDVRPLSLVALARLSVFLTEVALRSRLVPVLLPAAAEFL